MADGYERVSVADGNDRASNGPEEARSGVAASAASAPGSVMVPQCLLPDAQVMTADGPCRADDLQPGQQLDGAPIIDAEPKNCLSPAQ